MVICQDSLEFSSEAGGVANSWVRIERSYSLADAEQAHRDLNGRKSAGKLLLLP
jgi:hypothetical protein